MIPQDLPPQLIHTDRKVFLTEENLRDLQTEFGFDEEFHGDLPYRNGPKFKRSSASRECGRTKLAREPSQAPITHFFQKPLTLPPSATLRPTRNHSGGASSARTGEEEDEDDIDSDDIHESEVEDVNQAGNEGDY